LIKDYFDRQNGSGFAYAYQYPGFNRVLQATGRVIRTEADRGIIVLMDERFTHTRYRQLFPAHWRGFQVVQNTSEIKEKLARFWSQILVFHFPGVIERVIGGVPDQVTGAARCGPFCPRNAARIALQ
jgi:hypothetical protein